MQDEGDRYFWNPICKGNNRRFQIWEFTKNLREEKLTGQISPKNGPKLSFFLVNLSHFSCLNHHKIFDRYLPIFQFLQLGVYFAPGASSRNRGLRGPLRGRDPGRARTNPGQKLAKNCPKWT